MVKRMEFDVIGKLSSLRLRRSQAFLPIFEAVVNSLHAIQDRFGVDSADQGTVVVRLVRDRQISLPLENSSTGRPPIKPVRSVWITDNGVGFTSSNLKSFQTANSRAKSGIGGKGVGRFTWLVVFGEARVSSDFSENGRARHLSFDFRPTEAGIENYKEDVRPEAGFTTNVELSGLCHEYVEPLRKSADVYADRLFEHCFNFIVLGRCPKIVIEDDDPGYDQPGRVIVNDRSKGLLVSDPISLAVNGSAFQALHVQWPNPPGSNRQHKLHLCANNRVVTSLPLSGMCDLEDVPIVVSDVPTFHQTFITGEALDDSVDVSRTRFDLSEKAPLLDDEGELCMSSLIAAIGEHVNEHLKSVLSETRSAKFAKISTKIRTLMPQYKYLLERIPEKIRKIKFVDDERKLDEELYHLELEWIRDVQRRRTELFDSVTLDESVLEFEEKINSIVNETSEVGTANLVRYVSRRKAVLELLKKLISKFGGIASPPFDSD